MKRKIPFLHILFSAVLFWLSAWSFACNPAQGSGQCGYYDQYGRYQNTAIGSYVIPPPVREYGHSATSHSTYIPVSARPYTRFGAVSYSVSTGKFSITRGVKDPVYAEKEALRACGESDCFIQATYHNTCVSAVLGASPKKNGLYYFNV